MLPYKYIKPIAYTLITTFLASCSSTYEVTRRSEFTEPGSLGTLTVYTKNGRTYELEEYSLQDSTITGSGSILTSDSTSVPFYGPIKISDIRRMQSTTSGAGTALISIGIGAAVVMTFISFLNKESGMTNEVHIIYPVSSGIGCSMASLQKDGRPLAGGYKNMYRLEPKDLKNIKYLNAAGKSDTIHFTVSVKENLIELEMIKEIDPMTEKNEILTVNLTKEE
jgi:hypothetical protein